jgi:hypothetical protein
VTADDSSALPARGTHRGWLAVTAALAIYGAGTLGDLAWKTFGERAWWNLPLAVPGVAFFYWLLAGSWHRARARDRPIVRS